jgi:hypothetical protein
MSTIRLLPILAFSIVASSLPGNALALQENFEAGVPAGWSRSADLSVQPSADASFGSMLVLPSASSFVEVSVTDPSTLSFWRGPVRAGDDFVLVVEVRCGSDTVLRREYTYKPEGLTTAPAFIPEIMAVRHTGPCAVRWSSPVRNQGAATIDKVTIETLTAVEKERLAQEEKIREVVTNQLSASNITTATNQLDPLVDAVRETAPGLANLSSRVYAVSAINATGSALVKGAELGNPLNYDYFNNLAGRIESFSPLPMKTHIDSMMGNLSTTFRTVKNLSGSGVFSALSSLAMGTALGDFRSTFQSAIAVASMGKELLVRAAGALGITGSKKDERAETQLNAMYTESHTFLGKMMEQTQRVQARALRADSITQETNRLAAQADSAVAKMLRFAGVPDGNLGLFKEAAMKQADRRPMSTEETAILQRFQNGLQAARQRAVGAGSNSALSFAEQLRSTLSGSDAVYALYDPMIARQKKFYDEEIAYFCNIKQLGTLSLANTETQRQWIDNARAAARAFDDARRAFYQAFSPGQRAPVLERCAVLAA